MDIVTRAQWRARSPKTRRLIALPTRELWLHHTAGNEHGAAGMRQIQSYHMDVKGWSDIAYSFVIDPDSLIVYEGRGAGVAGGHTAGHNTISHAICVMGNFETEAPSAGLISLIAELVAHGYHSGWWPRQITGGHRQASGASTACPGHHLQAVIPTINQHARGLTTTASEETPMPIPSTPKPTWSLLDLGEVDDAASHLLHLYGAGSAESLASWRKDLAEKLRQRQDPRPTLDFIQWALQYPSEAAKL